ncbi:MAG: oligosaccharide flippase family protein [Desulfovibrio sp.]|jgi:O-antigen/teichoic acid export membrane protein|nr:oligosaccharide flippase family protein [Desulfovibrio sp.]
MNAKDLSLRFGLVHLLARRFGFMLCAQWGSSLLVIVFTVLLARTGPEILGLFTLALAMSILVTMITGAGFENYLIPRFSERRVDKRNLLAQTWLLQACLFLVSLALLALVCIILGYDNEKSLLIFLIAAGMGPIAMSKSFFALCRVQGRHDTEMRIRVPAGLAGSLFGIVALLLEAPLPVIFCFKLLEALVLFMLIGVALRWRLDLIAVKFGAWTNKWRDGFLFTGISVCGLLYNKLNLYLLDQYSGSYDLGLYSAPWEMIDTISALISGALIERVLFPLMAEQWRKDSAAFMRCNRISLQCMLLLGLFTSYLLFMEGDRLLTLIYGAQYHQAAALLYAQIPCILAAFLHNLAACMLLSTQRYRIVFLIYVSGLVWNIILCVTLIPVHSALGASFAITGTKLWMACLTVGFSIYCGLGFQLRPILIAAAAAVLAWGLYDGSLHYMPRREAAEAIGLVPLLALAGWWIRSAVAQQAKQTK